MIKKYGFYIVMVAGLVLAGGAAEQQQQKYNWPLDFNNGYSSSFQEFRSSHFHAGMDLRTFQKTGCPVYALADGDIYKIRMARQGTGRGLYLKHYDGNTSIYYHLGRFEEKLENLLKQVQQLKGKKYIDDYYLTKPLPYKRGELIGYSGETGAGFPHLHLEIRDKDYFAINPFKVIELPAPDKKFPVLKGLLSRSRGDSSINGEIGENYAKFRKKSKGLYVLAEPLLVTGNIDITLNTFDWSDSGKIVGPYGISAFIDGNPYFHLYFDRFQGDDNNQLGFVYDMFYSNTGTYFFNLFSQKGFLLQKGGAALDRVMENLDYGQHELKILVEDNYNNISTGTAEFYKARVPGLEISNITFTKGGNQSKSEAKIVLDIEKLDADPAGTIRINIFDDSDTMISSAVLDHYGITGKKTIRIAGVPDDAAYIDFAFYSHKVLFYKKRYLLNKDRLTAITDIKFDSFINRDEVFLKVKDARLSCRDIVLDVRQGGDSKLVEAQNSGSDIYFRFKPLNREHPLLLHFSILKDNEKIVEIQETLNLIFLEEGAQQVFKYHEFEAEFAARSVYEPRVLMVEEKEYKSGFPILSRQIGLSPYHFPFLDTVYYKFKKILPNPHQAGIFKYNPKTGHWKSCNTIYEPAAGTYSHRVISPGIFALLRDIFPPRIWFATPGTQYKKNFRWLTVKITDSGKGVDDGTLKIWLNGQVICKGYDCEYDPDRYSVRIEPLEPLQVGQNLVKVEVKDYAGNSTSRSFRFNLK